VTTTLQPIVGQNHLMQSLFCDKMMNILCNLWISVSTICFQHCESIILLITSSGKKIRFKIWILLSTEQVLLSHNCKLKFLKSQTILPWGLSVCKISLLFFPHLKHTHMLLRTYLSPLNYISWNLCVLTLEEFLILFWAPWYSQLHESTISFSSDPIMIMPFGCYM
jgi:hypothetical protein